MDLIGMTDVKSLMTHRGLGSVSIYMPSHPAGRDTREDPIRLKNLLHRAEEQMVEAGMREPEARERLAPARGLLGDSDFWRHQGGGLAMFLGNDHPRIYRLPLPMDETVVVNEAFHLKPLLPLLGDRARFYILAISQNSVRLLRATRFDVEVLELEGVPSSLAEVLRFSDPERTIQFHSGTAGHGPAGRRPATFHGQGVGTDAAQKKKQLVEYCHAIEGGVRKRLRKERSPLILAGAEPILAVYREVSAYGNLLKQAVRGNPDELSPRELHRRAVERMQPIFDRDRQRSLERYRMLAGTGRTSDDLEKVLQAAHNDQVETLFVAGREHHWGTFDAEARRAELHEAQQPGDRDLLDLAAIRTVLGGGAVYVIERPDVPGPGPAAATLRFPLTG